MMSHFNHKIRNKPRINRRKLYFYTHLSVSVFGLLQSPPVGTSTLPFTCSPTGSSGWCRGSWPWWPPPGGTRSGPAGPRTAGSRPLWAASCWTAGRCRGWRSCSGWPAASGWWKQQLQDRRKPSEIQPPPLTHQDLRKTRKTYNHGECCLVPSH